MQTISNYFIFLLSNKQKQITTLTTVKPCVNLKLTTDETSLSKSKIAKTVNAFEANRRKENSFVVLVVKNQK